VARLEDGRLPKEIINYNYIYEISYIYNINIYIYIIIYPYINLTPLLFLWSSNNMQPAKDQYCCELFSGVGEVAGGFRALPLN
jgi:hypothetical protein